MFSERIREKPFLTVKEFCLLIGIGKTALYDLWKNGKGPVVIHLGKLTLIPTCKAEEWANDLINNAKHPNRGVIENGKTNV